MMWFLFQMSPNNCVGKLSSKSLLNYKQNMNSILSNSPSRRFISTDASETSASTSIPSSIINGLDITGDIPQFNYEKERLKSFDGWPVSFLSPSSMASAGFYYMKREDIVRCAFCGVEVGCWVEGDNPMQDHERWSPSCRFVKKMPVGNIPISGDHLGPSNSTDVPKDNGK